jgi:rubrerythrin
VLLCGPAATALREGTAMPKWVCGKCKTVVEGRCRPAACPKCKAPKEQFKKKA